MLTFIVVMVLLGLVAGAVARLLVPGRDPMGIGGTIVLGIAGSFLGGFLGYVLFGHDVGEGALQSSGVLGSIVGAVILLLVWRSYSHRGGSRRGGSRRGRTYARR